MTADPPFSHLDLISCRNVLIYLSAPLQKRVLPTFHYALNVPGYLVLGSAETVGENADLFEPVDRTHKIYAKRATAARAPFHFMADEYKSTLPTPVRRRETSSPTTADFQKEADRILLGRYTPPGVLVNDNLDICNFAAAPVPIWNPRPANRPTTF